jgi:hypothetical protein
MCRDHCSNVRERCHIMRQARGTYKENALARGLRPLGAAGVVVLVRLHGPWRESVFRGSMVGATGAGALLQTGSDGGILNDCTV